MSTPHAESTGGTHAGNGAAIPGDTLAHRLMLARAHAGHISIREAAALCGLGRGSWTNWERGYSQPRMDQVQIIADRLGVDRGWLAFGGPLTTVDPGPRGGPGSPVKLVRHQGLEPRTRWFGVTHRRASGVVVPLQRRGDDPTRPLTAPDRRAA